jgi:hypothetical protein
MPLPGANAAVFVPHDDSVAPTQNKIEIPVPVHVCQRGLSPSVTFEILVDEMVAESKGILVGAGSKESRRRYEEKAGS